MGKLYLLHFERPYHHTKHYLGFTAFPNVEKRVKEHQTGRGANLTQHVVGAGIALYLAWVRDGDRREERRLKRAAHISRTCPYCQGSRRLPRAKKKRNEGTADAT